jgi:hypothetical protein
MHKNFKLKQKKIHKNFLEQSQTKSKQASSTSTQHSWLRKTAGSGEMPKNPGQLLSVLALMSPYKSPAFSNLLRINKKHNFNLYPKVSNFIIK